MVNKKKIVIVDRRSATANTAALNTTLPPHDRTPSLLLPPGRTLHFPGICRKMGERGGEGCMGRMFAHNDRAWAWSGQPLQPEALGGPARPERVSLNRRSLAMV